MLKFIHFGDLHVWRQMPMWSEFYYPKRWLGPVNLYLNRAKRFPPHYRQAAMDEILREDPDVAVFSGDFSAFSLKAEFAEAANLFAPLREKLGERLFAIPGNHDVYTTRARRNQVMEKILPWIHSEPVSRLDLSDRLSLVGVNHSLPFLIHSNGKVSSETQASLRQAFEQTQAEGRKVILVGHFSYDSPSEYPETNDHKLLGDDAFAELIQQYNPFLYLHGHQHVRWAFQSLKTPETLCLNCGSVGMTHGSPNKQAGFVSWSQAEDGGIENLTAHTFNGKDAWAKTPLERE